MAPSKPSKGSSKGKAPAGKTFKKGAKPSGGDRVSKSKPKSKSSKPGPPRPAVEQKSKPRAKPAKKKKRVYTEKELGIQSLNMITPAGVGKAKGGKKGKVFVDDQESMMTILAMVNADKEGQIESKMMKAVGFIFNILYGGMLTSLQRQMEEIRQARQAEMDAKQDHRKAKLVRPTFHTIRRY